MYYFGCWTSCQKESLECRRMHIWALETQKLANKGLLHYVCNFWAPFDQILDPHLGGCLPPGQTPPWTDLPPVRPTLGQTTIPWPDHHSPGHTTTPPTGQNTLSPRADHLHPVDRQTPVTIYFILHTSYAVTTVWNEIWKSVIAKATCKQTTEQTVN